MFVDFTRLHLNRLPAFFHREVVLAPFLIVVEILAARLFITDAGLGGGQIVFARRADDGGHSLHVIPGRRPAPAPSAAVPISRVTVGVLPGAHTDVLADGPRGHEGRSGQKQTAATKFWAAPE